ncbi:MAG: hypothetical protein HOV76_17485, partial [Hamadaea sp.]|nr:hypothetical protein [Hamadaea sp.]
LVRSVLLLAVVAPHGPGGYWYAFWTDPVRRSTHVTVAFALFLWLFVAAYRVLRLHALRRWSLGVVLVAAGVALAVPAALVTALGGERALTIWNDQVALLPWGLSRILGVTVYLGIPAYLPAAVLTVAVLVAAAGGLLLAVRRRTPQPS